MSELVIAYVKKHEPNGVRWSDLEKEFLTIRRWSKGKFVNHWKKAKIALKAQKDPKTGYNRYYIKEQFRQVADKAFLRSQISEGEVHEIEIPATCIGQAVEKKVEQWRPMFEDSARVEVKETLEKMERENPISTTERQSRISELVKKVLGKQEGFSSDPKTFAYIMARSNYWFEGPKSIAKIKELETKIGMLALASHMKIIVIYDKSEPLPILEEDDITNLLEILAKNLKARIQKPWHVIVSFHIPQEGYVS